AHSQTRASALDALQQRNVQPQALPRVDAVPDHRRRRLLEYRTPPGLAAARESLPSRFTAPPPAAFADERSGSAAAYTTSSAGDGGVKVGRIDHPPDRAAPLFRRLRRFAGTA